MQQQLQALNTENAKLKVIAQETTGKNLGVDPNQMKREMMNNGRS